MAIRTSSGQLIEDEQEQQPVASPAGAAAAGANPDQAKMVGSSAQKDNAITQAVAPEQTLQAKQRYKQPAPVDQADDTKASRLQNIGSLASRVDSMVFQQQEQARGTQAGLTIDYEAQGIDDTARAAVQSYLDLVNGVGGVQATKDDIERAHVNMNNALSNNSTNVDPAAFIEEHGLSLGTQYADATEIDTAVPLSSLIGESDNIADTLGYEGGEQAMADDLGVAIEDLGNLTLEDIQTRIKDIEAAEFSKADSLRADLISASPNERQAILEELAALGASGTTGLEAGVDKLNEVMESADEIEFGGQQFTVKDLLDNDLISDSIAAAVRSEDALEQLTSEEPALGKWIKDNISSLKLLTTDMEHNTQAFADVQTAYTEAQGDVDESLIQLATGMTKEDLKFVTSADLEDITQQFQDSAVFQAANEDPAINDDLTEVLAGGDSDLKDFLFGSEETTDANGNTVPAKEPATKEEILASAAEAKELEDPNNILSTIFSDMVVENGFVSPDQSNEIAQIRPTVDALADNPEITSDPTFVELIKDGKISLEDAEYLAEDPDEWEDAVQWHTDTKNLSEARDVDDVIEAVLGEGANTESVNKSLAELKTQAVWDPVARKKYNEMTAFFDTNGDGKVTDDDFTDLQSRVQGKIHPNLQDGMEGDSLTETYGEYGKPNAYTDKASTLVNQIKSFMPNNKYYDEIVADGKVTVSEILGGGHDMVATYDSLLEIGMVTQKQVDGMNAYWTKQKDGLTSATKGELVATQTLAKFTTPYTALQTRKRELRDQIDFYKDPANKQTRGPNSNKSTYAEIVTKLEAQLDGVTTQMNQMSSEMNNQRALIKKYGALKETYQTRLDS